MFFHFQTTFSIHKLRIVILYLPIFPNTFFDDEAALYFIR